MAQQRASPPVALVANPAARGGRAAQLIGAVTQRLRDHGTDVRLLVGADRDQSLHLCRQAVGAGIPVLAVLGGDGMVHLALQAVAGTPTALGIVPAGTGNDIATCLGVPPRLTDAVDLVAAAARTGQVRLVDAARVVSDGAAPQWWAGVLGAGFDSAVNERANRMRWPRGVRRYDLAIVAELARLRACRFELTVDGRREELLATFIAVGNAPAYGGGMRIAPFADLHDGQLDVTVVGPISRRDLVAFKPRVYTGRHLEHPAVTTRRGSVVRLDGAGQVAYADGERVSDLPVTAGVERRRGVASAPGT